MRNFLLFIMFFLGSTVSIYASFPVVEPLEPLVSGSPANLMAILSLACGIIAWSISWFFAIPGVIFGWLGTRGKYKYMEGKLVAWVGYGLNALAILIMVTWAATS